MLIHLIIFVIGICIGSFLNCIIYRLESSQGKLSFLRDNPQNKTSFLQGRSFCPKCKQKLGFFDLIPILSFLSLKGRCRYCHQGISWQYPIVEIITGMIFLLITSYGLRVTDYEIFNFQNLLLTAYYLLISCFLIIIFIYDLKHYLIPDQIIYPAIGLAFLYQLFFTSYGLQVTDYELSQFANFILAGFGVAIFFFLIWFISRGKWMGFGDVKLGLLMGLFLGYPNILLALFSAFLIGAIIGIGLILFKKKQLKSQVPFGPFLVIGTFIALFWGKEIINWYFGLIL